MDIRLVESMRVKVAYSEFQKVTTCFDTNDGTVHQYGESWLNSNCQSCVCSAHGYECCARYFRPTGYSDDCMVMFDLHSCMFRVHSKADPSVECPAEAAIGK
ncbi:prostate-associated microseminoprotein-like [Rhinoraja longicauda]